MHPIGKLLKYIQMMLFAILFMIALPVLIYLAPLFCLGGLLDKIFNEKKWCYHKRRRLETHSSTCDFMYCNICDEYLETAHNKQAIKCNECGQTNEKCDTWFSIDDGGTWICWRCYFRKD